MDINNLPGSLVYGFFSVLLALAMFTFRDLYRRLRKIEDSREEIERKLIAIEIHTSTNNELLRNVAGEVKNISSNCLKHFQAIREAQDKN